MTYAEICSSVEQLKKKYGESDPIKLCQLMGITVLYQSLGTSPDAIKGFFFEKCRIRTITINSDLPFVIQRIIAAHELCHAIHHRKLGINAFHDVALFDYTSFTEQEAHLFSAELLLDDEDVIEALNQDTTFFSAAAMLNVPAELLDFKFRVMKWKGYKIGEVPITTKNKFLANIHIPVNADYGC